MQIRCIINAYKFILIHKTACRMLKGCNFTQKEFEMDKKDASSRFRELATGDNRPATARLRDIFGDVELALAARVSQATVLEELQKLGYGMTMASFKSALQRIRKEIGRAHV